MEVPNYISSLLQPQAGKTSGRKVWIIDLETVWVPFFLATNTVQATAIPSDALGAPLRLAREPDGSVKFSKTGRPVVKVVKEVSEQVKIVRDNFVANLQSFTGQVMKKEKEGFAAQVKAAQEAGAPIVAKQNEDLELAMLERAASTNGTEPAPSNNGAKAPPDAAGVPVPA